MPESPRRRLEDTAGASTALQDADAAVRRPIHKNAVHQWQPRATVGTRHRRASPWHVRSSVGLFVHSRPEQFACPTSGASRHIRGLATLTETGPKRRRESAVVVAKNPKSRQPSVDHFTPTPAGPGFTGTDHHPGASFFEGPCRA